MPVIPINTTVIDMGKIWPTPGGPTRTSGEFSGEAFREDVLVPALNQTEHVEIRLDGIAGLTENFVYQATTLLICEGLPPADIKHRLSVTCDDDKLAEELEMFKTAIENAHFAFG